MAPGELDRRFLTFKDYVEWRAWRGLSDDESTPPYAHPVDGWILKSLQLVPVKEVIDRALDTLISAQLGQSLAQSVFIDSSSFPDLFDVLTRSARTLGIAVPHAVAGPGLFNAFTAGTDEYAFIFVTTSLLEYFTTEEAGFVMGHECGHIASQHMVYHTLATLMAQTAYGNLGSLGRLLSQFNLPLLAWSRRSEITADRAGLLCCGDQAVAERALIRLLTGFADAAQVDVDDYIRRYKDVSEYHGASKWQQMLYTHPPIARRIEALRLFARSELYYDLSGKEPPAGVALLDRHDLDRRVNQIVKP